jgi:hypothetical protein
VIGLAIPGLADEKLAATAARFWGTLAEGLGKNLWDSGEMREGKKVVLRWKTVAGITHITDLRSGKKVVTKVHRAARWEVLPFLLAGAAGVGYALNAAGKLPGSTGGSASQGAFGGGTIRSIGGTPYWFTRSQQSIWGLPVPGYTISNLKTGKQVNIK